MLHQVVKEGVSNVLFLELAHTTKDPEASPLSPEEWSLSRSLLSWLVPLKIFECCLFSHYQEHSWLLHRQWALATRAHCEGRSSKPLPSRAGRRSRRARRNLPIPCWDPAGCAPSGEPLEPRCPSARRAWPPGVTKGARIATAPPERNETAGPSPASERNRTLFKKKKKSPNCDVRA